MKDLNNLTVAELIEVRKELEVKGFKRAVGFVVVEAGTLTAKLCVSITGKGKDKIINPLFSAMTFARIPKGETKEIPLYWDAVKFNGTNNSSGKSYKELKVNANEDLLKEVTNPANYERECTLLSTISKDSQGRERAVITFVSWN